MLNAQRQQELRLQYQNEKVLVVPFSAASNIEDKFTTVTAKQRTQRKLLETFLKWESEGQYIPRYEAEYNDTVLQLIPYTIIFNPEMDKVYVSYRKEGDSRLTSKYSLGFGGHINPEDAGDAILNAANRELNEEVRIKTKSKRKQFLGYIRDMTSSTKEHLGFVFAMTATSVHIKERKALKGKWMDMQQLVENYYLFENWARYIIDYLLEMQKKNDSLNNLL